MMFGWPIETLRKAVMWFLMALIIGMLLLIVTCQRSDNANLATEARVGVAQGEAGSASAKVAIDAVGAVSASESAGRAQSEESENAIRAAPGADAPVNPAVRSVGLDRLCARRTYRDTPECQRRLTR